MVEPWWIAGGIALDLFVNRQLRSHHDVDVLVLSKDADTFRRQLSSWDIHAAVGWAGQPGRSDRLLREWPTGTPLPTDTGAFWCRPTDQDPWHFELLVNPSRGDRWQFKRSKGITLPLSEIGLSATELPT